jgi:glycosyltransferase involved in cell wall biosynthesis
MKGIAVVSFPWRSEGPYKFISELLQILGEITDDFYLVSGNTKAINSDTNAKMIDINIQMHYLKEIRPTVISAFLWILKMLLIQIKTSFEIFNLRKDTDIIIFYLAFPYFFLPLITSKLLGKKTIEIITRSKPNNSLSKLFNVQSPLIYKLLDGISPESNYLINDLGLMEYESKILPEGARFIDTNSFQNYVHYVSRENVIGFIGRLSAEKGILEFLNSIPYVLMKKPGTKFIIIGEGILSERVKKESHKKRIKDSVQYIGWVPNKDLSDYLNKLNLLVMPTKHNEGLPTIILEAMSCGTPVITTKVGGISDLIKDKKTGFIFRSTSPDIMAEDMIKALSFKGIENVIRNGEKVINDKYTFEKALKRYGKIINDVYD